LKEKDFPDTNAQEAQAQGLEQLKQSDSGSDTASDEDVAPQVVLDDDKVSEEDEPPAQKTIANFPPVGLVGLDRAAMERERLARAQTAGIKHESSEPHTKRQKTTLFSGDAGRVTEFSSDQKLDYPDGTIKWTWAKGFPKEGHMITIEEVLQKDTLKAAVLSGFQVNSSETLTDLD
jgi:hypothetical protein